MLGDSQNRRVALFKDGKPCLIAGSSDFRFVHGTWQYCTGVVEWGLSPTDAMNQPRFGLPRQDGNFYFESHYGDKVFEMLRERKIAFFNGQPSPFTELVGALSIDDERALHIEQDGRVDGCALAN